MKNLEFKLTCVDEASGAVAEASKRISDSLNEVSNSQNDVAQATEETVSPLSDAERGQLENAGSALQLSTAEKDLRDAQDHLNNAIRGYGTNSKEAASALRDLNSAQSNVSSLQAQVGATTKQSTVSMRSFTTGISGVATASFSLYGAFDRVNESEISLDRSNLMVKSSTKAVEDAQRALSTAILDHGASSQEAKSASDALSIAQDRLALADERALQAQENVNKSIMSAALQVIPTSITMVDSLSRAWKNFPDLTNAFEKLQSKISNVGGSVEGLGSKLKGLNKISFGPLIGGLAAVAVAAADAKYSIDQTNIDKAVYKAEHGAEMPWYETAFNYVKNFETAMPMIASDQLLAALGIQKPNVQQQAALNKYQKGEISKEELLAALNAVPHLAEGAIVDHSMLALIGEAGPEIVMPLARYEATKTNVRAETSRFSDLEQPQVVTVYVSNYIYTEADYDKASEHTISSLNESLARRRSS